MKKLIVVLTLLFLCQNNCMESSEENSKALLATSRSPSPSHTTPSHAQPPVLEMRHRRGDVEEGFIPRQQEERKPNCCKQCGLLPILLCLACGNCVLTAGNVALTALLNWSDHNRNTASTVPPATNKED